MRRTEIVRGHVKEQPEDRRKGRRQVINRVAHFTSEICPSPRACLLTDISDGGARLFTEIEMPPAFTLSVSGEGINIKRRCRIVWQLGGEIGVEFVAPEPPYDQD